MKVNSFPDGYDYVNGRWIFLVFFGKGSKATYYFGFYTKKQITMESYGKFSMTGMEIFMKTLRQKKNENGLQILVSGLSTTGWYQM